MTVWYQNVKGVLLDVTGVLYNSGSDGGYPIPGSIEAISKLKASGIPYKLVSNESTQSCEAFAKKLKKHGFDVHKDDIVCPAPVLATILKKRSLRPHLLVHPDVLPEFNEVDKSNPNCLVLGDAQRHFTYAALNEAFRFLLRLEEKLLFSMGRGKYYVEDDELVLDVGSYAAMLEFACGTKMEVCGKPEKSFFNIALDHLKATASECVMIGDDIVSDVSGAQAVGMRAVQVRTGKYRIEDEPHPSIKPEGYVDNLSQAVKLIIDNNGGRMLSPT